MVDSPAQSPIPEGHEFSQQQQRQGSMPSQQQHYANGANHGHAGNAPARPSQLALQSPISGSDSYDDDDDDDEPDPIVGADSSLRSAVASKADTHPTKPFLDMDDDDNLTAESGGETGSSSELYQGADDADSRWDQESPTAVAPSHETIIQTGAHGPPPQPAHASSHSHMDARTASGVAVLTPGDDEPATPALPEQTQIRSPARGPDERPLSFMPLKKHGEQPTYRELPLLPGDLPRTRIAVLLTSIKPNDRGKEVLSFVVNVQPGGGKEGWKIEKLYSDVLGLDHRVRAAVGRSVGKKIASLPEGKLWRDHAPAKADLRKVRSVSGVLPGDLDDLC
jgi:RalA-binding protein 1